MSVNINDKDVKNTCRACMLKCDLKFTQDNVISNIFYKLTDIHFETNGELPQQVCRNCFEKIIEIHAFSLQCKRTHSRLMKHLNNCRKIESNETQETRKKNETATEDEITVEEHKMEFVETNPLIDGYIPEVEIKQEIKEETNDLNEDTFPETSEFIDVQNIYPDDLSKPNTSNIQLKNEETSELNDANEDSSNTENSDMDSAESNKDAPNKTKDKKYKCNVCRKTFIYLRSFKKHRSLHGGGRPYKCKYCSKTFSESNSLTIHMRTHGAERPYLCPYCDWDFADFDELTQHKRAHTGKRPYQCSLCNSCFARKENLTNHLLVHSDEIPCECPICGKKFKNAEHMTKHRRTHTKEKPFKCEECDLLFQNLYNLQKHERAYHKNVQFQYEVS